MALVKTEAGKIIERRSCQGVLLSKRPFGDCQTASIQGDGLWVVSLIPVYLGEILQAVGQPWVIWAIDSFVNSDTTLLERESVRIIPLQDRKGRQIT